MHPSQRPSRGAAHAACIAVVLALALSGCASTPPRAPPRPPPPVVAPSPPPPVVPRPAPPPEAPPPFEPAITTPIAPPPVIAPEPTLPPSFGPPASPSVPPDAPLPAPSAVEAPGAPVSSARIVAVLPLDAAPYARVADAVRAGFTAAAALASTSVTIIPYGEADVVAAIDKARSAGAGVLVGPLLRDDLKALAGMTGAMPWTIALNQPDDGSTLPPQVFTLALSVDGEARQIARALRDEGVQRVAIVETDAPLQQRFAARFTDAWIFEGGGPPSPYRVLRDPDSLGLLRRELTRNAPEAIILAADGADAALVKPYLPVQRVYASSQVNERQPPEVLQDLEGIHFVEVPLLADPTAPELAGIPDRDWGSPTVARLYALGFDAFTVATAFDKGPPQRLEIDGASGHLTLGHDRNILREGRWMHFEGGRPVPDTPR